MNFLDNFKAGAKAAKTIEVKAEANYNDFLEVGPDGMVGMARCFQNSEFAKNAFIGDIITPDVWYETYATDNGSIRVVVGKKGGRNYTIPTTEEFVGAAIPFENVNVRKIEFGYSMEANWTRANVEALMNLGARAYKFNNELAAATGISAPVFTKCQFRDKCEFNDEDMAARDHPIRVLFKADRGSIEGAHETLRLALNGISFQSKGLVCSHKYIE